MHANDPPLNPAGNTASRTADNTVGYGIAGESRRGEPPHYPFRPVPTRALGVLESEGLLKLTAIVAPVGYGKTVLMSALHRHMASQGCTCLWTTLDERECHAEDLLEHLEWHSSIESAPHPTQTLFQGERPPDTRVDALIQAATAYPEPLVVFIDNLHFCTDAQLGHLLERLIFTTPDSVRFVISATATLPLDLTRARLEGRVRQIGFADLGLDLAGISELLGPDIVAALEPDDLATVLQRTEGWPAAARMMQIAMANSVEPASLLRQFSGSDEDVVALLNRQVLDGLPPATRDFLLDIAPFHTFDAAMCAAATGQHDAQTRLDELVRHNVFMIPLDRSRSRYRLHGLFRQCLLAEAGPRRKQVLARAARWCAQRQQWRDAIEYALASEAFALAADILERSGQTFVRKRGDAPHYIVWAGTVIESGQTLGWFGEYWYVWALTLSQRYEEGRQQLEKLARRIARARRGKDGGELHDLARRLDIVRMSIDVFTDDLAPASRKAAQWLAESEGDDPFDVTVARCIRSIHGVSDFAFAEAREMALAAQSSSVQARSEYAWGWTQALLAFPSILCGQYAQPYADLRSALVNLPAQLGDNAGICGTIALLAAKCAVEMGQDDDARLLLDQGLQTADAHGFIDAVASGLDAALKLWPDERGDIALTDRLREIAAHFPPRLAFILGCHRIRRLLRLGNAVEARAEAANLGIGALRMPELPDWARMPSGRDALMSTVIDLRLAAGEGRSSVEPLIAEQIQWAKAGGRVARQIDLLLASTLLEIGDGQPAAAARFLIRAISLAAPRHIVRPFRDLASQLAPLVEDTRPSAWGFAFPEERHFFADLCARMPIGNPTLQERLVSLNIDARISEPLTRRQSELLRLLEAGLSNQQIADRIDRSLTTVKGHLQGLYAKLGVSSRSAALARARVLSLL